jgi:hypothetical protein
MTSTYESSQVAGQQNLGNKREKILKTNLPNLHPCNHLLIMHREKKNEKDFAMSRLPQGSNLRVLCTKDTLIGFKSFTLTTRSDSHCCTFPDLQYISRNAIYVSHFLRTTIQEQVSEALSVKQVRMLIHIRRESNMLLRHTLSRCLSASETSSSLNHRESNSIADITTASIQRKPLLFNYSLSDNYMMFYCLVQ